MRLGWRGTLLSSIFSIGNAGRPIYPENYRSSVHDSEAYVRNATDNLVFTSVASLLQQWPNTRYRNGHTIIKATIPVGTTLYHGRGDKDLPLGPEWLAFNVEHSYLVCAAFRPEECWMHTLAVEEELQVIYFDGSSAANAYLGHLDSQDIIIWGEVRRDKMMAEWERISELCKWGGRFYIDAIVRMEPGFEVMLCDFTKKVKLVSSIRVMNAGPRKPKFQATYPHILEERQRARSQYLAPSIRTSPQGIDIGQVPSGIYLDQPQVPDLPVPPNWKGPLRDGRSISLETILAAGWNNFYPGEVRAQLDYRRFISFYDPAYTSLLTARAGISRDRHRLLNISQEDLHVAMTQLEVDLERVDNGAARIDWSAVMRAVTDRYADRLFLMKKALGMSKHHESNTTAAALTVRSHLMVMLTPYLVYGALPNDPLVTLGDQTTWVAPITSHCESSLTTGIAVDSLTRSERLLKSSIEGVLHRICSSLTVMWADAFSVSTASEARAAELVTLWKEEVDGLMRWLDWPLWDICRPACSDEMFCYIATWPWAFSWTEEDVDTIDMTPRCINRESSPLTTVHGTESIHADSS